MTKLLTSIALLHAIIVLNGCRTALLPARYVVASPFVGESVEFKTDGTFAYHAKSDDGPTVWDGTGTWQWADQPNGMVETHVTHWNVSPKNADPAPLRDQEKWTISRSSACRPDRQCLKRQQP